MNGSASPRTPRNPSLIKRQQSYVVDFDVDPEAPLRGEADAERVLSPKCRVNVRFAHTTNPSKYQHVLWLMITLSLINFLSMGMVIPTMPEYLERHGGDASDYYKCLAGYAVLALLTTAVLGPVVDGGRHRMLPCYVVLSIFTFVGNLLYSLAGAIPLLSRPVVILCARCLVGAGSSSSLLTMVFLGEMCDAVERPRWVVRNGLTRSQGLFWGPPLGSFISSFGSWDNPYWNAATAPAWAHLLANFICVCILVATWPDLEEEEPEHASDNDDDEEVNDSEGNNHVGSYTSSEEMSVAAFIRQPNVLALLWLLLAVSSSQVVTENMVPVVTAAILNWQGAQCGAPLSMMALTLTLGQVTLMYLTRVGVNHRTTQLIGVGVYTAIVIATIIFWQSGVSLTPVVVLAPFVLVSFWGPFCMLSSFSMYLRLTVEQVPRHKGMCQAVQSNLISMSTLMGPAWLTWSYSSSKIDEERVPLTCFVGLAVAGLTAFFGVCLTRPAAEQSTLTQHLLPPGEWRDA